MTICAYIVRDTPVLLWGISSRERLRRVLRLAGITRLVDDLASCPAQAWVLLLRADYLYDERLIKSMLTTCPVILEVPCGQEHIAVAAYVPASLAPKAHDVLGGAAEREVLSGVAVKTPEGLTSSYREELRKFQPAFVRPILAEHQVDLEEMLFSGAYKGITDLVTKWVWPKPAKWATRWCVRFRIQPNQVTVGSLLLVIVTGVCFAYGLYGWGLLCGWLMTFLDTVDGKLARVTVTGTRLGHVLDHGLDIIHPPLWYIAWGLGLMAFDPGLPWLTVSTTLWAIVIGYIVGRLVEGVFQHWLGGFGIFSWRPIDSYFRLITARHNPNLILLTGGVAAGRPDLGLVAVACWTALSSILLLGRLMAAAYSRMTCAELRPWLADIDSPTESSSLAVRLFTTRPARQTAPHYD